MFANKSKFYVFGKTHEKRFLSQISKYCSFYHPALFITRSSLHFQMPSSILTKHLVDRLLEVLLIVGGKGKVLIDMNDALTQ